MKIGDKVKVVNRTGSVDSRVEIDMIGEIVDFDSHSKLYPYTVAFNGFLESFNCVELKLIDDTPDLSDEPHANELINALSEAQNSPAESSKQLMNDIISEEADKQIHDYLVRNLTLKYKLVDDEKPAEIVLELAGKILGRVKL
jgi:hypothetical protein